MISFPKREHFFKPVLQAIQQLGGSGTNEETNSKVIEILNVSEDLLAIMHKETNQTEFEYQMAWVRTMLKSQGLLENSRRGVWSLNNDADFSLVNPVWDKKMEKKVNEEVN